jgi:hypothetical protein
VGAGNFYPQQVVYSTPGAPVPAGFENQEEIPADKILKRASRRQQWGKDYFLAPYLLVGAFF